MICSVPPFRKNCLPTHYAARPGARPQKTQRNRIALSIFHQNVDGIFYGGYHDSVCGEGLAGSGGSAPILLLLFCEYFVILGSIKQAICSAPLRSDAKLSNIAWA
ncbi:hypothetical protein AVEN_9620-1 [Araneus ventricosus]|uniref:Uncharacterized protein n=1 Tax=Araneus ventricosus TaxID=182803 RepID=A0A4Y2EYX9_ARAVE|nr:hypothetical protein AVEN_9620-1 [Araneus ventricosus]